eukprot:8005237-Pyramimonas_sp.AAC.1
MIYMPEREAANAGGGVESILFLAGDGDDIAARPPHWPRRRAVTRRRRVGNGDYIGAKALLQPRRRAATRRRRGGDCDFITARPQHQP